MLHKLPKTLYDSDERKYVVDQRLITNIFTRISMNIAGIGSRRWNIAETYTIKDSDSPESIAETLYDQVKYWWVVLILNPQLKDPSNWPMSDSQLEQYMKVNFGDRMFQKKFNGDKDFDLPFIVDGQTILHQTIQPDDQYTETSWMEYARIENDKKRIIRTITPELVVDFQGEFEKLLRNYVDAIQ